MPSLVFYPDLPPETHVVFAEIEADAKQYDQNDRRTQLAYEVGTLRAHYRALRLAYIRALEEIRVLKVVQHNTPDDEAPHVHDASCYDQPRSTARVLKCGQTAGEPAPAFQGSDAAEFGEHHKFERYP